MTRIEVKEDWQCQRSGDCCRMPKRVTMTFSERRILEAQAALGFAFRALSWRHNPGVNFTELVASPCPFVTDDNKCNVYEHRPYNCRRFGCMRPDNAVEPFDEKMFGLRLQVLPWARDIYAKMQAAAQPWALAHGWKDE